MSGMTKWFGIYFASKYILWHCVAWSIYYIEYLGLHFNEGAQIIKDITTKQKLKMEKSLGAEKML